MPDCRSINSSISFRLNWSIPLYFSVLTLRPTRAAPSQGDEHLLRPLVQSEHVQLLQPPVSREDVEPLPGDHSREKTLMRSHSRGLVSTVSHNTTNTKTISKSTESLVWTFHLIDWIKQIKHDILHLKGSFDLIMTCLFNQQLISPWLPPCQECCGSIASLRTF